MSIKIKIIQTPKGFTGYMANKIYKAPTRQGVIDLAMSEWLTIEDMPKCDLDPLMKRIRYILEQCPTKSLYDLFCYDTMRWDFENWHDNDAFLKFIEVNHAIEPQKDLEDGNCEDLVTVLEALGFKGEEGFEIFAYVRDQGDAHWIIKGTDLYYYIASLRHVTHGDALYYYERTRKSAYDVLGAVAHAPKLGRYSRHGVAIKTNLAQQVLHQQIVGEVNYSLTGDEK